MLSRGAYDEYFAEAQRVRRLIADDFVALLGGGGAMGRVDVLLTPTTPTPARRLASIALSDPLDGYADDVMTVGVSLAGLPAVSMPVAFEQTAGAPRLPIGVQLVGRFGDDMKLLHVASFLESTSARN